MTARFLVSTSLAGAMLLSGCGGQSSTGVPAQPAAHGKKGTAVFRIRIPKKAPKVRIHGHYVSPATTSMSLALAGPTPVSETVGLTAGSTGCTSSVANTLCQLSLPLSAGSYTATITTFDANNQALSTAQAIAFTVVAGTNNAISLTLSGIPSSLLVVPGAANSVQNTSGGIDLLGTSAHKIIVEALDADSNLIVGPGAPSFVVSKTSGNLNVVLTQPAASSPGIFTVAPPSAFSQSTATLHVAASYSGTGITNGCAQSGAVCFANVVVDMREILAVADETNGDVELYELPLTTPFATISGINATASGLAFDASGNLFVANCQSCPPVSGSASNDTVLEYAPPYAGPAAATISSTNGTNRPVAIVLDPSADLFVANYGNNTVVEYKAPYTSAAALLGSSNGVDEPTALALDLTNDLFVANTLPATGTVLGWPPPYTGSPIVSLANNGANTSNVSAPIGLSLDPSGNHLLVVNSAASAPNLPAAGSVTVFNTPLSGINTQNSPVRLVNGISTASGSLAFDANGDVFVPNGTPSVVDYNAGYTNGESGNPVITNSVAGPSGVVVDGLNDLYVANATNVTGYAANYGGAPFTTISSGLAHPIALAILP